MRDRVAPVPRRLGETTLVLREDAGLGEHLDPVRFEAAAANSLAAVFRVARGPWEPPRQARPAGCLGFLVLEGLVARRVTVAGATWTELLGPGDVLEPGRLDRDLNASIPPSVDFELLSEGRLAVLGPRFLARMAAWPEVTIALSTRLVERAQSLSYVLAACGRVGVAERIVLVLRHLADRWGHVTRDGVVVDLPGVTHELIATMIGAARPSVSTALGDLKRRGVVGRQAPGMWLLCPPGAAAPPGPRTDAAVAA